MSAERPTRGPDPVAGAAVPIRVHNLLCLQGFQGVGYDDVFTANMAQLHTRLLGAPETPILVVRSPDHLCSACPHLLSADADSRNHLGCGLGGKSHEAHMRRQDEDVSARLGVRPGEIHLWHKLLGLIASRIDPVDLPAICTTCPWLPLGVCAEGIVKLKRHVARRKGAPGIGRQEE